MNPRFFSTPVTIKHRSESGFDRYGNAISLESEEATMAYWNLSDQTEYQTEANTLITRGTLLLPATISLSARDAVVIGTDEYEIASSIVAINPRNGRASHVVAQLIGARG